MPRAVWQVPEHLVELLMLASGTREYQKLQRARHILELHVFQGHHQIKLGKLAVLMPRVRFCDFASPGSSFCLSTSHFTATSLIVAIYYDPDINSVWCVRQGEPGCPSEVSLG